MALSVLPSQEKITITLDDVDKKPMTVYYDENHNMFRLPIYRQEDSGISGRVKVNLNGKKIKHQGIMIQLIGETETYHSTDKPQVFLDQVQELEDEGELKEDMTYDFSFPYFEKRYETYYGMAGRIRYYLKAVIMRDLKPNIKTEQEFGVQLPITGTIFYQSFEIQLRIADYLMLNVELNKTNLHMDECLLGKIVIEQIRLLIKKIQVSIVRREITAPTQDITCTKEDILCKQDLAGKCPKKGNSEMVKKFKFC